jgi:transmembrane sensor
LEKREFISLIDRYLDGNTTGVENCLVENYLNSFQVTDTWDEERDGTKAKLLSTVYAQLVAEIAKPTETPAIPVHRVHFIRRFRWVAAAAILFAVATTFFLIKRRAADQSPIATFAKVDVKAPSTNRATVTLGNGQTVDLDSAVNGQLAMESNVKLVKLANGQIVYTGKANELIYNTINNPKGSKPIDIGLSDGSHMWLNAGSSITYPVAFMLNKERRVIMTGEAYFEIKHTDNNLSFIVQKENTEVKVLGTHFNVKAYDNEPNLKVTLLEGSVSVNKNNQSQLLKPNQQAVIQANNIELVTDADTDQAIAWKNGITSFHSADLQTALRELERWYNITTEIKGTTTNKSFFIEAPRSANLKDVLKSILEDNNIAYEFDEAKKKLTVLP